MSRENYRTISRTEDAQCKRMGGKPTRLRYAQSWIVHQGQGNKSVQGGQVSARNSSLMDWLRLVAEVSGYLRDPTCCPWHLNDSRVLEFEHLLVMGTLNPKTR